MPQARAANGQFICTDHAGACRIGIAKALLARCLTAQLGTENDPTPEEMAWTMRVLRERPEWAETTLRAHGC